jgi:hypothetical protein
VNQKANERAATELHKSYVNKDIGFDEYHCRMLELEKNDCETILQEPSRPVRP